MDTWTPSIREMMEYAVDASNGKAPVWAKEEDKARMAAQSARYWILAVYEQLGFNQLVSIDILPCGSTFLKCPLCHNPPTVRKIADRRGFLLFNARCETTGCELSNTAGASETSLEKTRSLWDEIVADLEYRLFNAPRGNGDGQ